MFGEPKSPNADLDEPRVNWLGTGKTLFERDEHPTWLDKWFTRALVITLACVFSIVAVFVLLFSIVIPIGSLLDWW
jgi:hypothetical protein